MAIETYQKVIARDEVQEMIRARRKARMDYESGMASARARMVRELVLKKRWGGLWLFDRLDSREQGEQEGRAIAHILAIPFEVNSDFER